MRRILPVALLFCILLFHAAVAQDKGAVTEINDKAAAQKLLGKHKLSLQWISWDHFGTAIVKSSKCGARGGRCFRLTGEQRGRGNSDYLRIAGSLLTIDSRQFKFRGKIEMQVSHINGGKPCVRSGDLTFKITGKRKYWRLMEMDNPCDEVTDYVDIYFR